MKSNLSGLIKMLKEASGLMHTFYLLLKDHKSGSITQEELEIASGKLAIDSKKSAEFVEKLKGIPYHFGYVFPGVLTYKLAKINEKFL
ncbi:hypothetical protein H0H87_003002 [Tephrocybe sp. NHM501043]|nr:hypothetical protein H0H87_003002 [Tephrocybe sp. NHM501043]